MKQKAAKYFVFYLRSLIWGGDYKSNNRFIQVAAFDFSCSYAFMNWSQSTQLITAGIMFRELTSSQ